MIDYVKLVEESRFYFSEPNHAKPPTAGLWHNKSTHVYEVWDFVPFRKKQRVFNDFKKIAYIKVEAKEQPEALQAFFDKVMDNMINAFGHVEAESWLRTGKSSRKPEDGPLIKARFH